MSLQDRLLSPFAAYTDRDADADVNGLIRRVLLSDTLILESARLSEFPSLIRKIGFDRTIELLNGPGMWLKTDPLQIGDASQARTILSGGKPNLPLYHYDFGWITVPDQDKYLEKCFSELDASGLQIQQVRKLHRTIWGARISRPEGLPARPIVQLLEEAEGHPGLLKRVLRRAAERFKNLSFDVNRLTVHVRRHQDEEAVISIESNLAELCGIPDSEAHKLWQSSLMAVGALFHRLAEMNGYQALSGFNDDDVDLFIDRLAFLLGSLSPDKDEEQFQRVIRIASLPIFEPDSDRPLDVNALFTLRQSREVKEFRLWLKSTSEKSDAEIQEQLKSVKARLGNFATSALGKTLRFVTLGAVGIPAPATGIILSGLDTFLTEKLLPASGVAAFVSRKYQSLFKKDNVSRIP